MIKITQNKKFVLLYKQFEKNYNIDSRNDYKESK